MRFGTADIAAATGGRLQGPDVPVEEVAFDSRRCEPGSLFVPLVAERDGHDFVAAAVAGGAVAYLTSRPAQDLPAAAIEVSDTSMALMDIGRAARSRLPDRVVAVTGSVGKSSVKDMAAAVLARRWVTTASPQSFNNEIGLPLTLANAPEATEAAVLEMGARGIGHIRLLCEIGRPTVGIVTCVASVHTALFGSLDDVATGKGELVESLPQEGIAVLNAADPRVRLMRRRTTATAVTFAGSGPDQSERADVTAEAVELDADLRARFILRSQWGTAPVELQARGRHNVGNALAAAAAALALGLSVEEVAAGLAEARLSSWRMDLQTAPSGLQVLNDAYNANPTSMAAALEALSRLGGRRRIAVLGVMAELSEAESAEEHRRVADQAAGLGIELVAVGTSLYGPAPVADAGAAGEVLGRLDPPLGPGDAVLVKGSRVVGLENVALALLET